MTVATLIWGLFKDYFKDYWHTGSPSYQKSIYGRKNFGRKHSKENVWVLFEFSGVSAREKEKKKKSQMWLILYAQMSWLPSSDSTQPLNKLKDQLLTNKSCPAFLNFQWTWNEQTQPTFTARFIQTNAHSADLTTKATETCLSHNICVTDKSYRHAQKCKAKSWKSFAIQHKGDAEHQRL